MKLSTFFNTKVNAELKMNSHRAKELLVPLREGKVQRISSQWQQRMIEALERVIELEEKYESFN